MQAGTLMMALVLVGPAVAGCLGITGSPASLPAPHAGGFSTTAVVQGDYATDGDYARVLRPGPYAALPGEISILTSAVDGADIQVAVLRPDTEERVPVIAYASPYLFHVEASTLPSLRPRITDNFVSHGYAVAFVAVRGSSGSGGCIEFLSHRERADLDQAITWLGEQPWSSGAVGMTGISYEGSTPWEVASLGNPYLKTIVPVEGVPDLVEAALRNGTVMLGAPIHGPTGWAWISLDVFGDGQRGRPIESAACPEQASLALAAEWITATQTRDPFGIAAARNYRPEILANYRGSVLLVHGLGDAFAFPHVAYPFANELASRGVTVKHLLGRWAHMFPDERQVQNGPPSTGSVMHNPTLRWDFAEILLHWFDYWLKGDTSADLGPRVEVADTENRWRFEEGWPPPDASAIEYFLTPDRTLGRQPSATSGRMVLVPDPTRLAVGLEYAAPGAAGLCPGCVTFATEPFARVFRFAGLPQVHLTVVPTGPGGHVTATFFSESPAGRTLLSWGQMDLRFAAGGEEPRPVIPGQPLLARLELEPTDAVVAEGAKLVLVLSEAGYGTKEVGYMTYFRGSVPTYPAQLHVGGAQSVLRVLTFERTPDDPRFFEPPASG